MSTSLEPDGKAQAADLAAEGAGVADALVPIKISPDAQPALDRLEHLWEAEPRTFKLWRRQCRELKDQADYDVELAAIAVRYEWADQEVVDLLIAHGRKHGQRLEPAGYYAKIITRARAASPGIGDAAALVPLVDQISARLGLPDHCRVVRIEKYISEPREYLLVVHGGSIRLGGVENLVQQNLLGLKLMDVAGVTIRKFKGTEWREIVQLLLDACVEMSAGEEATDVGLALSWLRNYLATNTILPSFSVEDESRLPFAHDGRIHVYMAHVRKFVFKLGDRVKQKDLLVAMRRAGAEPVKINAPADKTSRQAWKLPAEFGAPQPAVPEWVGDREAGNRFVDERLDIDPSASMTAAVVRDAYQRYCDDHHVVKPISPKGLAGVLRDHGCQSEHRRDGDRWRGIRPKDEQHGLSPR